MPTKSRRVGANKDQMEQDEEGAAGDDRRCREDHEWEKILEWDGERGDRARDSRNAEDWGAVPEVQWAGVRQFWRKEQ